MTYQEKIIEEILAEREYQDYKWGGNDHDDAHSSHDWVAYLSKHLGKSVTHPWDGKKFREQMTKIAALAVAAAEWYDRNEKKNI